MTELRFDVEGYPPAKSEALSMLGAGHSHGPRVRALLEAAHHAIEKQQFEVLAGPIGLALVVYTPEPKVPSDATNFLGGVADVLEDKSKRGSLAHLGDLAGVHLYTNDQQIQEVQYRQVPGEKPAYRVRVWPLFGGSARRQLPALLQRITTDPDKLAGKPTIRGRRLAVEHVLGMLALGDTPETLMAGYSWMESEDILACLAYAYREAAGPRFADTDD